MTQSELISAIEPYGFPQMMLTRNTRSFLGSKISDTTKGFYNHFCWLINPDTVASQDWIFHTVPLKSYLNDCFVVKFITDTRWSPDTKLLILNRIWEDLKKSWHRRLYDPLAIFGQWSGMKWIQNPLADICSDKAKYLKKGIDPDYNLLHPSPTTINEYQKAHQKAACREGYFVTARWMPEDI